MKAKEYNNLQEMFDAHNKFFAELDEMEAKSRRTYSDIMKERGITSFKDTETIEDVEEVMLENGFNPNESYFIPEANLSSRAYQYDKDASFKIGNNKSGGI